MGRQAHHEPIVALRGDYEHPHLPSGHPLPHAGEAFNMRFAWTTNWIPGCAEDDGVHAAHDLYTRQGMAAP